MLSVLVKNGEPQNPVSVSYNLVNGKLETDGLEYPTGKTQISALISEECDKISFFENYFGVNPKQISGYYKKQYQDMLGENN